MKPLTYIGIGALVAAGVAIWFLWSHLQDAQAEAHQWQQNAQTAESAATANQEAARLMALENERLSVIVSARERDNETLRDSNAKLKTRLSTAIQEAPDEIRECFALPVPDALSRVLREYPEVPDESRGAEGLPARPVDPGLR